MLVLLKAGARPDRADNAGKTALSIAEAEDHPKLVDLLSEWAPARPPTPEPEAHPIEPDAGAQQAARAWSTTCHCKDDGIFYMRSLHT